MPAHCRLPLAAEDGAEDASDDLAADGGAGGAGGGLHHDFGEALVVATAGAGGAGDEGGEAAEDGGGDGGSWLRVGRWREGVLGSAGGRLRGGASLACLDGGCGVGLGLIGGWDPGLGWGPGGIGGGGWGGGGGGAVFDAFVGAFSVDGGVVDAGD